MEKQAKEKIPDNIKKRINEIDNLVDYEKRRIKKFDNMQEEVIALNKNLNKCIDLLSKSIEGPTKKNMLNDMYDSTKSFYMNFISTLDEEISSSRKNINKLAQEKDDIIKQNKNKKE